MIDNYWLIENYSDLLTKVMKLWLVLGIDIWQTTYDSDSHAEIKYSEKIKTVYPNPQLGNYTLFHSFICEDTIYEIIAKQNLMFIKETRADYLNGN